MHEEKGERERECDKEMTRNTSREKGFLVVEREERERKACKRGKCTCMRERREWREDFSCVHTGNFLPRARQRKQEGKMECKREEAEKQACEGEESAYAREVHAREREREISCLHKNNSLLRV